MEDDDDVSEFEMICNALSDWSLYNYEAVPFDLVTLPVDLFPEKPYPPTIVTVINT